MKDKRFSVGSAPQFNAFELVPENPILLRMADFTFIFFSASLPRVRLLHDKRENYQLGTIQFQECEVSASEYVGRPCVHCKQSVDSVGDCCVAINQGSPVAIVHESCFREWFTASDKGAISPYRLIRGSRARMVIEGSSFKVQINNDEGVDDYTFTAIDDIKIKDVATHAPSGTIVQQGAFGGYSGTPPQGVDAGSYMAHMQTMAGQGGGAAEPSQTAVGATPNGPAQQMQAQARSAQQQQLLSPQPAGAHRAAFRTEVCCPYCGSELVVTIETKPS